MLATMFKCATCGNRSIFSKKFLIFTQKKDRKIAV